MERITVVKIGGNVIDNPAAMKRFLKEFAALEGPKILVHGGGKLATRLAERLELEYGILTRCGLHCAPSAHKTLGTFPQGTVRFSIGYANAECDVDAAISAIKEILR